ncbi:CCA tRNA nucleotidyltransferase [Sandarakinorhabdus limnophila]|uniref:CCA tRNA nucleotidyltransferase n=1 Tax=Sandarakinorhabdus limnophila TaxID=210512 RepID=UPI0003B47E30|nr:CCA tRNA nucleotidyltransferase [Sandarakinorhabdus limnophila]
MSLPQTLPTQAWANTPAGVDLLAALEAEAGETRLVGGAVRDGLLGLGGADIDLATRFAPDEVMRRVKAAGLKAVPTGIAHGTVTVVGHDLVAEVTTLRRDVQSFGRHAQVAFTDDWREDAARRDFTVNALYAHLPDGVIDDYWGGLDDLSAHRVRFIGDPLLRIAEDHLRILRFFRFSARFAGQVDADGLAACTARANDLMALSRERIAMELRLLLALPDPVATLALMLEAGIFRPVLPELDVARLPVLVQVIVAEAAAGLSPAWERRLAALLPPGETRVAAEIGARLKLSNARRIRLVAAVQPAGPAPYWPMAYKDGGEAVVDRLLIAGDAMAAVPLIGWHRPRPPASGKDIIARGVAPGPEVAKRLGAFERAWVAAGFPNDTETVAALLDAAVQS